jgi:RimJ/RimL family protein N-acetyltransferase
MRADRPVGPIVDPKPPGLKPDLRVLDGTTMRLEPVDAATHGASLFALSKAHDDIWTYLGYGPFVDEPAFLEWLSEREASRDPWFYAFVNRHTEEALGMGAFMRLDATHGVIEIGHIWMTPPLQRTRESTEVIYLMMRHCFDDLKVRRLEWKCDSLNAPSRRAAARFGYSYEGTFRQHFIIKGRNRDTAWFAMMDHEWPDVKARFESWLAASNFDAKGVEIAKLQVR